MFLWLLSFFCFSSSFCRSRLYPLPLKHVAASTAARFNFSVADGCFNVWSPLSPICPCAIQLTSGECPVYDSTFSSSLSSRSARKTQVRSRKKHRNGKKNTFGSRKKTPCSGKKLFPQREKTPAKNAASQREKFKAAEKTPCSSTKKHLCSRKNAFWRQREKTVRGGKKPVRGKKKTGRGRKKTSSRESPALQPKKLPQRKKYISATGKSSSPFSFAVCHMAPSHLQCFPCFGFCLFCYVSCLLPFSVSLHDDAPKDCVLVLHQHYFCGPSSTKWGN